MGRRWRRPSSMMPGESASLPCGSGGCRSGRIPGGDPRGPSSRRTVRGRSSRPRGRTEPFGTSPPLRAGGDAAETAARRIEGPSPTRFRDRDAAPAAPATRPHPTPADPRASRRMPVPGAGRGAGGPPGGIPGHRPDACPFIVPGSPRRGEAGGAACGTPGRRPGAAIRTPGWRARGGTGAPRRAEASAGVRFRRPETAGSHHRTAGPPSGETAPAGPEAGPAREVDRPAADLRPATVASRPPPDDAGRSAGDGRSSIPPVPSRHDAAGRSRRDAGAGW